MELVILMGVTAPWHEFWTSMQQNYQLGFHKGQQLMDGLAALYVSN